ncbi:MAG: hypothetical protein GX862_01255 [Leucobacter sp.]|nr:hypothetical protein [Leucobacter sp.]
MHEQRSADVTPAQFELANQGDESAIARILVDHLGYWQRAALSITRNEHEADDLVQDTIVGLIGAWRRADQQCAGLRHGDDAQRVRQRHAVAPLESSIVSRG